MKILLEIKDEKAPHLVALLKELKFVKTTTITPAKALLLKEMKEAIQELNLVKKGKKKANDAEKFINGL
ncbi:MAG: hypothetical protein K2X48_03655 [Chitinophagaceae bacterium]|nr:hypothetical protein [Chitinophagaceae bacterium]